MGMIPRIVLDVVLGVMGITSRRDSAPLPVVWRVVPTQHGVDFRGESITLYHVERDGERVTQPSLSYHVQSAMMRNRMRQEAE